MRDDRGAVAHRRRVFWCNRVLRAEIALLFVGSGVLGSLYYAVVRQRKSGAWLLLAAPSASIRRPGRRDISPPPAAHLLPESWCLLTFGSGLVIVPFLEKGLVQQAGWLDERRFLLAVAIGMLSPGPVVITATFVG